MERSSSGNNSSAMLHTAQRLPTAAPSGPSGLYGIGDDGAGSDSSHEAGSSTPMALDPSPTSPLDAGYSMRDPADALAQRRMSLDTRRVHSESLPGTHPRRHMSMAIGKRPSIVTGGYESSTDDDDDDDGGKNRAGPSKRPRAHTAVGVAGVGAHAAIATGLRTPLSPVRQSMGIINSSAHLSAANNNISTTAAAAAAGRRRAQSLMSPPPHDFAPSTSPISRRTTSRLRPPSGGGAGSPLSPRGNASPRFSISGNDAVSRNVSLISELPNSRSASMRSVREGREPSIRDEPAASSSRDMDRRGPRRSDPSKANRLQASLGLGAAPREVVLTADQIQDLLGDADVSSAIQLMRPKPPRRQSSSVSADHPPLHASASSSSNAAAAGHHAPDSSPPTISRPYLVSAPPALTNGDWHGRDRTVSVSSSMVSTPQRNVTPLVGRRRHSSLVLPSDEGGHVPFTHHVTQPPPETAIEEEDDDDDDDEYDNMDNSVVLVDRDDASDAPPSTVRSADSPVNSLSHASTVPKDHDRGKRRISSLFGLGRKKHDPTPAPAPAPLPAQQQRTRPPSPPRQAEREARKSNRDQAMRLAEQERRNQELEQGELGVDLGIYFNSTNCPERRYRALVQIHAHPAAQKRAQQTAIHLDSLYAAVNDALVHPPKLNPLAILRWKRRTEEQKSAKARWESEQVGLDGMPLRNSAGSPTLWSNGGSVSSPRVSIDNRRGLSPYNRSVSSNQEHLFAPGWHYTLDDINAYNACSGKVNFWFPPMPIEHVPSPVASPVVSPRESTSDLPYPYAPQSNASASTHLLSRPSISDSLGEREMYHKDGAAVRIASPSMPSLVGIDHVLDENGAAALSRQSSLDNGHRLRNAHSFRGTHRAHQSTTGIPQQQQQQAKPLQALRAPFEKLGNAARRNITLPVTHMPNDMDDDAPARRPGWLSADAPAPPPEVVHHHPGGLPPSHHSLTTSFKEGRDRLRRGISTATGQKGQDNTTGTSEDEGHTFRRLLGKGQRALAGPRVTRDRSASISRAVEARNLEESIARQRQIRHTEFASKRPTELEIQTQARLQAVENDIYAERELLLVNARHRTDELEAAEQQMDFSLAHYIHQLDQVKTVFATAADVNIEFDGLDALRGHGRKPNAPREDDESADSVAPLRHDSDRGGFSAGGNFSDGRFSPIGNGVLAQRKSRKPQPTMPPVALPSFAFGLQAWPKRSTLDPTLGVPVDPIRRVELSCEKARQTTRDMAKEREETTKHLQGMVSTVNQLIYQKDEVRRWTKGVLDEIATLKEERNTVLLKIKGGLRPRMWRATDDATDLAARTIMSLFSYAIRVLRGVNWVRSVDAGWLAWALVGGMLAMLVFFYWVGSDVPVSAPAAAAVTAATIAPVVVGDKV